MLTKKILKQSVYSSLSIWAVIGLAVVSWVYWSDIGTDDFAGAKAAEDQYSCIDLGLQEEETIYERISCFNCGCSPRGEELFTVFGSDAECYGYEDEDVIFDCLKKHSYPYLYYGSEDSFDKFPGASQQPHNYYLGGAGTIANNEALEILGGRTYLAGFRGKEHNFYTNLGTDKANPITFSKNSGNVIFNKDLSVRRGVDIGSSHGGIFLDSDVSYGEVDFEMEDGEVKKTRGIKDASLDKGIGALGVGESEYNFLRTGSKNMFFFGKTDGGDNIMRVQKGAEIRGDIMMEGEVELQGKRLHKSAPIRGSHILYYK